MKTILAILFSSAMFFATAQDTTIIRMEYFIDADPGVGNATAINIPSSSDVNFPFTLNLTGYSPGYHKLYIRTRDNLGRWSITARRNIEVLSSSTLNNVVTGEYFIDEDPGFGAGRAITITTAGEEILENFTAALTGLSVGYHKLYGRVKDTHGKWSLTFRRNIEVIKDETAKVVNGEYFFKTDNGLGDCVSVVFTTPSADGSFTFNILPAQMPADADTLFVRVRDDVYNNWSLTRWTAVNNVLPLVMLHFEAALQSNTVQLKWQTANEINTSYFNVQRSADSRNFTTVGIVKANNVSGINHYSYEDNSAGIFSQKLYYRLQAIDIDASSKYSEIKVITIGNAKSGIRLYPNPVYNNLSVISTIPHDLKGATITVLDAAGKSILKQALIIEREQQINISQFVRGIYIVRISKKEGVVTFKILKE